MCVRVYVMGPTMCAITGGLLEYKTMLCENIIEINVFAQ